MQWGHLPPPLSHHQVLFSSSYRPHWDGNTAITAPRTVLDPIPAPQPLAPSARLLPQCHRADTSLARTAGQTDASRQPLRRRSRVTERRDRLILRLFIGISLGSARAPRPRRAGAWLTGRHCGGFAMQRPPTRPRPCSPHPGASLSPRAPRSLHKTPLKKKTPNHQKCKGVVTVAASPRLSPHQSLCMAPGCKISGKISGKISTSCTPVGLSWGLSPGFSWGGGGAVLGQAQMRGGTNCPWVPSTVAAPFSQRLGDPGWGFPGQRFLRSAELLFSSTVGGLCHRLVPRSWGSQKRRLAEGPGFGTAKAPAPSPAAPMGPQSAAQGQPGQVAREKSGAILPAPRALQPHLGRGVHNAESFGQKEELGFFP